MTTRAAPASTSRPSRSARHQRRLALWSRRARRDPHVLLAVGLTVPVATIELTIGLADRSAVAALSLAYVGVQAALSAGAALRSSRRDLVRLGVALAYVGLVTRLGSDSGGTPPLAALYLPLIALAAMFGLFEAVLVGGAALAAYLVPVVIEPDATAFTRERAIVLAATGAVLAVGTRQTVASLERAIARVRRAMADDRRRARQLAAVEEVGRLLAGLGPTDDALAGVMDLLVHRFGYRYASIYLGDARLMRLGAQRGYEDPIHEFEPTVGVCGRVMRTREPMLVPDVDADPDYVAAKDRVLSLISAPLIAGGELIGLVNVETEPPHRLDSRDLAAIRLVADRLASALALAHDRERLARRSARFEALTAFAQVLTATLEPQELYGLITRTIGSVLPADIVTLTVRERATGEYRIVATPGGDERYVGARIEPGEGLTGRAIETRAVTIDEAMRRERLPTAVRGARVPEEFSSIAVPLVREGDAIGAIALSRTNPPRPFDEIEREILPLIGAQAALALANAELHAAATEASIRDPLTGMHNRRHLDASLVRLSAARSRTPAHERRPLAAILFDLDHFGRFNKRYGHAVGDEVLRRFGELLRERFRASDLLARFGGEEFVVVLDGATRDEAVRLADEIRLRLEATPIGGPNGEPLTATVSAGCAGLEADAPSLDGLLEVADVGLSMAKSAGRNRVVAA